MNVCLCVFRCPQDFEEYEKMISFVNSFSSFLPANGSITFLEDENDKQKFKFHLRNEIDGILGKAIEENRFQMYYQPIYSVAKKQFTSAEALIRLCSTRNMDLFHRNCLLLRQKKMEPFSRSESLFWTVSAALLRNAQRKVFLLNI